MLEREHFHLFGNGYTRIDRDGRSRKDGVVDRTAPGTNRPSTTMENCYTDGIARCKVSKPALCLVQFPAGGQDTPVFTTVGITQHYLLLVMTRLYIRTIQRVSERPLQYICAGTQIFDSLEKRHDR